jgi:hypothetical protein
VALAVASSKHSNLYNILGPDGRIKQSSASHVHCCWRLLEQSTRLWERNCTWCYTYSLIHCLYKKMKKSLVQTARRLKQNHVNSLAMLQHSKMITVSTPPLYTSYVRLDTSSHPIPLILHVPLFVQIANLAKLVQAPHVQLCGQECAEQRLLSR